MTGTTLWQRIYAFVVIIDPKFPPQGIKEPINAYLLRVCMAISTAPLSTWEMADTAIKNWYNKAAEAIEEGKRSIPIPQGLHVTTHEASSAKH